MAMSWSRRMRHLNAALAAGFIGVWPLAVSAQRLVVPRTALMDEPFAVRATGLRPGARVMIRATMPDSARRVWSAEAEYVADARGEIDVSRDPSVGGAYDGVDAMGLVTAMDLPDQPGTAVYVAPALDSVPTTFALSADGRQVDSAVIVRRFVAPSVRVVALDRATGLVGTYFAAAARTRAPAVLVLGGSEGGNSAADVASLLASHGFATLSLAYFGVEPLARELDRIPLEYFGRAIDFLALQPGVDSTAIGVLGTSKGAEAALLVAARDARIRAVAAYAPSSVAWSCICASADHSSWSVEGTDVPNVPPGRDPSIATVAGQPMRPVVHYRYRMRDTAVADRARIPVERINGPVMLVAGEADALWPSAEMARALDGHLSATRGRTGDTLLVYAGAGHRIGKAYVPAGTTRMAGGRLETGGSARANAAAQADAWPRVLRFLERALGDARPAAVTGTARRAPRS
jgi:dienelactone hydrolase